MVDRKVVPFDEFYYQLKLTHVFQKHPVYYYKMVEAPIFFLTKITVFSNQSKTFI
jgi:hypothetical protein